MVFVKGYQRLLAVGRKRVGEELQGHRNLPTRTRAVAARMTNIGAAGERRPTGLSPRSPVTLTRPIAEAPGPPAGWKGLGVGKQCDGSVKPGGCRYNSTKKI